MWHILSTDKISNLVWKRNADLLFASWSELPRMMHQRGAQIRSCSLYSNQPAVKFLMQTPKPVRIREYRKVAGICTLSVNIFLFKDPGIIRKAVDHLFYSIEETPDRYFLMQVSKRSGGGPLFRIWSLFRIRNWLWTGTYPQCLKCWRKNFWPIFKFFTQKIVSDFSKIWVWDPRSGIRKKLAPDPGSRGQKGTGSWIRIRNTAYPASGQVTELRICTTGTPSFSMPNKNPALFDIWFRLKVVGNQN